MPYKIAICDDERADLKFISGLVLQWAHARGYVVQADTYQSAESFLFCYGSEKIYDILLLDIEMGGLSGVELARQIREDSDSLQIIFITGHPDYVNLGYDVDALHYLIKPVDADKLFGVLDKAIKRLQVTRTSVVLPVSDGIKRLDTDAITYAEASAHYTQAHTRNSEVYKLNIPIGELEALLCGTGKGAFLRCHRSFIVGLGAVSKITKQYIILDDGTQIPLSRRLYDTANKAFIKFYGSCGR